MERSRLTVRERWNWMRLKVLARRQDIWRIMRKA